MEVRSAIQKIALAHPTAQRIQARHSRTEATWDGSEHKLVARMMREDFQCRPGGRRAFFITVAVFPMNCIRANRAAATCGRCQHAVMPVPGCSRNKWYRFLVTVTFLGESADRKRLILNWLPPRDSNPDMLIQRHESDDCAEFLRCCPFLREFFSFQ